MSRSDRPASARNTPVDSSNDNMRSASTVDTTSWSGDAGSDESPYDRPSPRDRGRPSVMRARFSERTSCASTTGARPHPASCSALGLTPGLYQASRPLAASGAASGQAAAAQLLDQRRPSHAEQLRRFLLVELRACERGLDVRV